MRIDKDTGQIIVSTVPGHTLPARLDIDIIPGQTWDMRIRWERNNEIVNASSDDGVLNIRTRPGETALVSLSGGSGITFAATAPNIHVSVDEATTAGYSGWLQAVWSLEVDESDGTHTVLLEGYVTLRKVWVVA